MTMGSLRIQGLFALLQKGTRQPAAWQGTGTWTSVDLSLIADPPRWIKGGLQFPATLARHQEFGPRAKAMGATAFQLRS